MFKKNILLLIASTLLIGACSSGGNSNQNEPEKPEEENVKEVGVSFNKAAISEFEIENKIYGGFSENFHKYIYGSVWSELILDRKFIAPAGEDVSRWTPSGNVEAETSNPYQGSYSVILNSGASITNKDDVALLEKDYVGYFWAKGNGVIEVKLSGSKELKASITINSNDYQKYEYNFSSSMNEETAIYSLKATSGSVTLDSVSLMPGDNYKGMRRDVVDSFKNDVNITYLRFPGGNMVSGYDWRGGIGDRDKRDYFHDDAWYKPRSSFASEQEALEYDLNATNNLNFYAVYNPNDFGLDDYMNLCEYIDCEPNIIVNSGLGTAEMAAQEVEYINGDHNTEWGSKRPRVEPYNVKLWGIGNEMQGDWQLGHVNISEYTKRHNEFAAAMREKDPTIKLIACGENNSGWSQSMYDRCGRENIDYISEHFYCKQEQRSDDSLRLYIIKMSYDQFQARIDLHRSLKGTGNSKMAIDEFAYEGLRISSRMRDAYMLASSYYTCQKNGDVVGTACYSFFVGSGGLVNYDRYHAYTEAVGYTISLFSRNALDHYIPIEYKGGGSAKGYYEIAATINEDGTKLALSVLNTCDYPLKVKSDLFKSVDKIDYIVGGDPLSYNYADVGINITRHTEELNGKDATVKAHSISVITISI